MYTTSSTTGNPSSVKVSTVPAHSHVQYRLYKKRFSGLLGFVLLGLVTGMPWSWFGPIAPDAAIQFGISVTQVNWLSNIVCCLFIPVSLLVPVFCSRVGITRCVQLGALFTLISGWVRYAATSTSLSPQSAYTLLMFGQIFSAITQPIFQVLGPMYSEKWFDLKGRTTATMLIAVANPIGGAIAQLLSPLGESVRQSILLLAIISSAVIPAAFIISNAPPTPPTYSGSKPSQTLTSLSRAVMGWPVPPEAYMTLHERIDFVIITLLFGVFVGATTALSTLSGEWFNPMGYSDTLSGLFGASLLLSGILASALTSPLMDRIFTHRLGITLKVLVPIVAAGWFSLIWAVRPNNIAALFVIFVVIGICSLSMLPIALELGVELTRNADGSASILWCSGNLFAIILILGALRAPATANPPYNMRNALILTGPLSWFLGRLYSFCAPGKPVERWTRPWQQKAPLLYLLGLLPLGGSKGQCSWRILLNGTSRRGLDVCGLGSG
ncbi:major facilitator superfamily domain-containing protein [Chiua virens]|nr:major facilitator superfamily domain-containing protein [Chiua virens]